MNQNPAWAGMTRIVGELENRQSAKSCLQPSRSGPVFASALLERLFRMNTLGLSIDCIQSVEVLCKLCMRVFLVCCVDACVCRRKDPSAKARVMSFGPPGCGVSSHVSKSVSRL